jgi:large subunit ribosomal protein L13
MKTFFAKESNITPQWLLVNADGKVLGRLAVSIATVLMGKHLPSYTPNQNCGDFVVVVNAEKVRLTGKKLQQKSYSRWTGYPGGRRVTPIGKVLELHPERVLREAVRRMLPKGLMGKRMLTRLKVYAGVDHPHAAQRPEPVELAMK